MDMPSGPTGLRTSSPEQHSVAASIHPVYRSDDSGSDGESTDREHPAKRSKNARGRKRSEEERKMALKNDEWVLSFDATTVTCRGCRKVCKLNRKRRYALGNWAQHRDECEFITGKRKIRAAVKVADPDSDRDLPHTQVRYKTKTISAVRRVLSMVLVVCADVALCRINRSTHSSLVHLAVLIRGVDL